MRDGEPTSCVGATKDPLPPDAAAERRANLASAVYGLLKEHEALGREADRLRSEIQQRYNRLHAIGRRIYLTRLALAELVDER